MKRKTLIAAAALALGGLAAAGAQAASDDSGEARKAPPRAEWMSIGELATSLEAKGYTIHEIDTEHGSYEVEMTDANGMKVEARLDPVTGEPLRRRGDGD